MSEWSRGESMEGGHGVGEGERRRVEPLLRVARGRPLTVRLVLPVNLQDRGFAIRLIHL